jgi:hypothetical protein
MAPQDEARRTQPEGAASQLGPLCGRCQGVPYRPPSVLDVEKKTRKAELSDQ